MFSNPLPRNIDHVNPVAHGTTKIYERDIRQHEQSRDNELNRSPVLQCPKSIEQAAHQSGGQQNQCRVNLENVAAVTNHLEACDKNDHNAVHPKERGAPVPFQHMRY